MSDDGGNCNMMNQEDEAPHSIYDYVIIGAGPSACGLLHGLLSHEQLDISSNKHKTRTICLIEAGSSQQQTSSTYAKDWPKTALYTNQNNNNYISTPQSALNNRTLDIPIGNGLGGTSNINACLLSSPDYTTDFAKWPKKYQDGMLISNVCDHLVSFMKSSDSVNDRRVCDKFMNVLGDVDSCSGVEQQDSVRLATTNDGLRVNYFESLVQHLIDEQQIEDILTIRTNTVTELLLWHENNNNNKEKQITGVVCKDQQSNQKYIISANKEVILCTGAIHSPVLLMRSGIGDESELRKLDIHCNINKSYHNLPGVGKKLKDHLVIPRAFLTSSQVDCRQSLNGVQTIFGNTDKNDDAQYVLMDGCVLKHAGPLMVSSVFRRDYLNTTNSKNIITYIKQYTFHIIYTIILTILQWAVSYIKPLTHFTYHTSTLLITILHPKSHGTVTLTLSNQIRIDPGYLTDESDYESIISAWNQSTQIKDTIMNKCWEILPGSLYKVVYSSLLYCWSGWGSKSSMSLLASNEEEVVITYAKQFMQPYFHYIGTCSMISHANQSTNQEAVVDENFNVIGMQGLRICDASVFVDCISAPTALTCASLGYVLSDILKKEEG